MKHKDEQAGKNNSKIEKSKDSKDTMQEEAFEETVDEILEEAGLEEGTSKDSAADHKEAELREAKDRIIRLMADFDNYRKRVQREKEDWLRYSSLSFVEKILPVIDNLERAMENLDQQGEEIRNIFSGVKMTYKQLTDMLQQEGMTEVEGVGSSFDPMIHEAVLQVPAEGGQEDNEVAEVLRKGYRFKEKLIRPAMVKVAKR